MNREDPRKLIIEALKQHPEGLTIVSIAQMTGLHRHTSTKYIHELMGAGAIIQRNVGAAKLCYLENMISEGEERNLLEKLERRRSIQRYNLKLIASVVLITFLLSEATILAYENNTFNETLDNTSINTSPITSSIIINETNISNFIEITIENSSNGSVDAISSTVLTTNDSTYPFENNLTDNETSIEPKFDISLDYPQKIARGEDIKIKGYATNIGSSEAKNVVIRWVLPSEFEITSGNSEEMCGNLESGVGCISEVTVKTSLSAVLGINDIKIVVNYEE